MLFNDESIDMHQWFHIRNIDIAVILQINIDASMFQGVTKSLQLSTVDQP